MNNIKNVHDKVLDHLIELRKTDSKLFFVPRMVNRKNRLDKGYWFIGSEGYLHLSFRVGRDIKERVHNMGFVILEDGKSYIELTARGKDEKTELMKKIMSRINGFEQVGKRVLRDKWYKNYQGTDYIKNLDDFIKNIKPIIDEMVIAARLEKLTIPTQEFFDKYGEKVIRLRKERKDTDGLEVEV